MYSGDEKATTWSWESLVNYVTGAEDHRASYGQRAVAAGTMIDYAAQLIEEISNGEDEASAVAAMQKEIRDNFSSGRDVFLPALGVASNKALISYWLAVAAVRSHDWNVYEKAVEFFNQSINVKDSKGVDYQDGSITNQDYANAISFLRTWMQQNPKKALSAWKTMYMLGYLSNRKEAQEFANVQDSWYVSGSDIVVDTTDKTRQAVGLPIAVFTGQKPDFFTPSQWFWFRFAVVSGVSVYAITTVIPLVRLVLESRKKSDKK